MATCGRYFEIMRAVLPVSVKTAMAPMGKSSAEWAMDSQMVSATESPRCSRRRRNWTKSSHVAFGFDDDARHDGDRFARVLAAGGFGREHDGVGAVEDGVGHVAGFGARGARVFDHRLEHLRGGDDGLAPGRGAANDVLLNDRDFFRRHFDAEIAAGDHDSVGGFENFFQMIDGLRLFELGDDGNVAAVRGDDLS